MITVIGLSQALPGVAIKQNWMKWSCGTNAWDISTFKDLGPPKLGKIEKTVCGQC